MPSVTTPTWTVRDLLPDRVAEQVEPWTTWARRAWEPGTVLRIKELVEACRWVEPQVLSDGAVQWLRTRVQPLIGQDPGLANGAVRQQLQAALKDPVRSGSQKLRRLQSLIDFIEKDYLGRWRATVATDRFDLEQAARFISSHVLDHGLHPEYLRLQLRGAIRGGADGVDLVDLMEAELNLPPRVYVGWVRLKDVPHPELMEKRENWHDARSTNDVLRAHNCPPTRSQSGSLRFRLQARDIYSAATEVYEDMERLKSRTRLLRSKQLTYEPRIYFEDGATLPLRARHPQISAVSLARTEILYTAPLDGGHRQAIDDSLFLAADLLHASPGVAAGSAWASLESLLGEGDPDAAERGKVIAADRAASIIAASWPRAELTKLSYSIVADATCPTSVKSRLDAAGEDNAQRANVLWKAVEAGISMQMALPREQAALLRMQELCAQPMAEMRRVQGYLTASLRRLYRQRNLVLHGGAMKPVALRSALRTAGPLVAASLDRISYCLERNEWAPLDTVARAELAVACAGKDSDWPVPNLLSDA